MTDRPAGPLPRMFGKYLLFDHIGRGGMADIYLASLETDLGLTRRVVIKQILPHLVSERSGEAGPGETDTAAEPKGGQSFAEMLVAEAKLSAGLQHQNIVQVFDLGREGQRLFIAMDYVEGFDLNQLLRRLTKSRVPLPAEYAILIVRAVLSALGYAHRARSEDGKPLGIVHRDVSPSNVLISFEGEVKLCDFGIARAMQHGLPEDVSQGDLSRIRLAGKSAYMAPEHARGEEIDARADVFAAGILLWELCAGRRLYKGSEPDMLAQAKAGDVPTLPDRGLPSQDVLQAVLDRALAKTPEDRFESAESMREALEDYAMSTRLMASELKFGDFLSTHFAEEVVDARRRRETDAPQVLRALSEGPALEITPLDPLPEEATDDAADADSEDLSEAPAELPELESSSAEVPTVSSGPPKVFRRPSDRPSTRPPSESDAPAASPEAGPKRISQGRYVVMLAISAAAAFGLAYALIDWLR